METNQQLFAIEDENQLYTKLILDLFCAVYNSFNIFLVNYLGDVERYKELFIKYKEFVVSTAGEIENFTSEALQLIKNSDDIQNPYQYISLEMHSNVDIEKTDSSETEDSLDEENMLDNLSDEAECEEKLHWSDF